GKTGMIKPIARMSSVTVTRMKMTAAGRDFIRVEDQRNVVAAVVSTAGGEASPRTMLKSPKVQKSGGQAACQRVEDNAFHLAILRDGSALLPLAENGSA